jgi:hypothetical protein
MIEGLSRPHVKLTAHEIQVSIGQHTCCARSIRKHKRLVELVQRIAERGHQHYPLPGIHLQIGEPSEVPPLVVYNEHWEPFTVTNLSDWSRGNWKVLARSWFGDRRTSAARRTGRRASARPLVARGCGKAREVPRPRHRHHGGCRHRDRPRRSRHRPPC